MHKAISTYSAELQRVLTIAMEVVTIDSTFPTTNQFIQSFTSRTAMITILFQVLLLVSVIPIIFTF